MSKAQFEDIAKVGKLHFLERTQLLDMNESCKTDSDADGTGSDDCVCEDS